jgi:hypothetical protein
VPKGEASEAKRGDSLLRITDYFLNLTAVLRAGEGGAKRRVRVDIFSAGHVGGIKRALPFCI